MRTLLPVLGLTAVLAAQPSQRFKSSVDVVQVDVSAIDGSGWPIRDLTAADFEVRVDGRVRPIVSAQFVAVPPSAAAPRPASPPDYLVVDREAAQLSWLEAMAAAALPPGDYVARAAIAIGPRTVGRVVRPFRTTRTPATGARAPR